MNSWIIDLLQSSDSSFPSGSYAHSLGLEGYVELDIVNSEETLLRFLSEEIVPSLVNFDYPYFQDVYQAVLNQNLDLVMNLDREYLATRLTRELRQATVSMGRRRLELFQILHPTPAKKMYLEMTAKGECAATSLVVASFFCAERNVPLEAGFLSYGYGTLSGCTSAALKLVRIGQDGAQRTLTGSLQQFRKELESLSSRRPAEPRWFNPLLEIASARHERAYSRLFIS